MSAKPTISAKASDVELSRAVAEFVCRMSCDPEDYEMVGAETPPPYAVSVDALLPLLERLGGFDIDYSRYQHPEISRYQVKLRRSSVGLGKAETLARAACFALLRAHGVEVTE